MKIWLNGQLVDRQDAKLSVFDHATLYGDGVFEGIRAYGGKIFQRRAHLDRLFASAAFIRLNIPYTADELAAATLATMAANGQSDCYIRMVVTRGDGTLGLNPFKCPRANVFIIADQIELYPKALYEHGMPVIISKILRTSPRMLSPKVKSLNYLNNIMAKIECVDAGMNEAVMLNEHGNVAEGSGDNIFIVSGGVVTTPPEEAGILMGVTRGVVIRLCSRLGIAVQEKDFTPRELLAADECFMTGTAAEIIPVNRIDGTTIGGGRRGPVTHRLVEAFHAFTRSSEAEG